LEELVMLLQASIELAHTERWALERGELAAPPEIASRLRTDAYEVTVVDQFQRVARRFFERNGYRAVWERPFHTGRPGHPASVDIAAFNNGSEHELRIELGVYSKAKLRDDSRKLAALAHQTLADYPDVVNILLLWALRKTKLTRAETTRVMDQFKDHCELATGDDCGVEVLISSSADLFEPEAKHHRHVTVGLFKVT
jgi:hypothetical protein